MLVRIASGAVLTVIVGAGLIFGGPYLFLLTLAISLVGMFELYRVYGIEKSVIGIIGYVFGQDRMSSCFCALPQVLYA